VHPLLCAEEHAIVSDSLGIRHSDLVEPLATYNILRLKKDILNNSSIGFIATHAARSTERPATTSGLDWRLNFLDNMYNFTGQGRRSTGMGTQLRLSKNGGDHIGGNIRFESPSPGFGTNDLGFQRRSNVHNLNGWMAIRGNNPWKFTRRRQLNFNTWGKWNYDGKKLSQGGNINGNVQFTDYWFIGGGYGRSLSAVDDRETRDNGLVRIPEESFVFFGMNADFRRRVNGGIFGRSTSSVNSIRTISVW
jgi:hypothetical protein